MLTLTRDDLTALLAAEEALRPHLPDDGVPGTARLFKLFAEAHRLVADSEVAPKAEPWGLAAGRRRGTPAPVVPPPPPSMEALVRAQVTTIDWLVSCAHILGGHQMAEELIAARRLLGE